MSEPRRAHVVIIGGGPAGLTAAVYAARANLSPLCVSGVSSQSQISVSQSVENYPGFGEPIAGMALIEALEAQAKRYGAEIDLSDVVSVDTSSRPFRVVYGADGDSTVLADAIIFAAGAFPRTLDVPGAEELWGKGISSCAICDSHFAKDKVAVVVGGGDAACEEALYLAKIAREVHLVHRRDELRASAILQKRLFESGVNIIWDHEIVEMRGGDALTQLVIENSKTGERSELDTNALYYGIGHIPASDLLRGQVELDKGGFIVHPHAQSTMTSVPGVFSAGDVSDHVYRQAVYAAGQGSAAAIDAERWLNSQ